MAKRNQRFKLTDLNISEEGIAKFFDAIHKGIPFKNLISVINDNHMENLYGLASCFYDDGRYEDAMKFFAILVLLDSHDPRFAIGLGACYQSLERYVEATTSYNLAFYCSPNDPRPACYCADCYLVLGNIELATSLYKKAAATTENDLDKPEIRQKAEKMHKILLKEYNSKD